IIVCLLSLPGLLMTSACGPKTGGLSPVKIPANNDAAQAPTMDAEAAALQLAEFDLSKAVTIAPDRIAEAAAQLSFPKTILLGPGSTETTALQIAPAPLKIMASECDNVMPALDRISGQGETLTIRQDSIDRTSFMPGVLRKPGMKGSMTEISGSRASSSQNCEPRSSHGMRWR
ncbi:MAG: hypothetical protein EBR83_00985, partial [Verrucomicrobia bacterium]|nr:hypothetical protein [Verrucomicrobiota bacterium]